MEAWHDTFAVAVRGLVFLGCGIVLVGIGVCLLSSVMHWQITQDGAGLAVLWLFAAGGVTVAIGGEMLVFARRPLWLVRAFFLLVAIFVVSGIVVTLQSGARLPRLNL